MTIYEIDSQIQAVIDAADPETGEIDADALESLQMERDRKVENLACAYKNLIAEASAIKAEEDALAKRRKATEAKADRAKNYLEYVLSGERFKSARVSVSYRTTQAVELDPSFMFTASPDFLRVRDPEPNKTAIMQALKQGQKIPGAALVDRKSTLIK